MQAVDFEGMVKRCGVRRVLNRLVFVDPFVLFLVTAGLSRFIVSAWFWYAFKMGF